MTPLRQQMIRQMDLKNLSPHTRRVYLSAVTNLAKHYRQSPETITAEMIEIYLLYLKNGKSQAPGELLPGIVVGHMLLCSSLYITPCTLNFERA